MTCRGLISGVHVFWYKLHCKVLKILHLHLGKLQFIGWILSSLASDILVVMKAGNNCSKLFLKMTEDDNNEIQEETASGWNQCGCWSGGSFIRHGWCFRIKRRTKNIVKGFCLFLTGFCKNSVKEGGDSCVRKLQLLLPGSISQTFSVGSS